jgi:hypothetical protein
MLWFNYPNGPGKQAFAFGACFALAGLPGSLGFIAGYTDLLLL